MLLRSRPLCSGFRSWSEGGGQAGRQVPWAETSGWALLPCCKMHTAWFSSLHPKIGLRFKHLAVKSHGQEKGLRTWATDNFIPAWAAALIKDTVFSYKLSLTEQRKPSSCFNQAYGPTTGLTYLNPAACVCKKWVVKKDPWKQPLPSLFLTRKPFCLPVWGHSMTVVALKGCYLQLQMAGEVCELQPQREGEQNAIGREILHQTNLKVNAGVRAAPGGVCWAWMGPDSSLVLNEQCCYGRSVTTGNIRLQLLWL